jgi:chromosome segregation ATPase
MEQQQAASEEMQAHCNVAITQISETQGDLSWRSQELADSQSDVEQLTERKAQLDGQIAVLDGKLASTEQALCKTEDDLATWSQELVGSQSEVAQLSQLKVQWGGGELLRW